MINVKSIYHHHTFIHQRLSANGFSCLHKDKGKPHSIHHFSSPLGNARLTKNNIRKSNRISRVKLDYKTQGYFQNNQTTRETREAREIQTIDFPE